VVDDGSGDAEIGAGLRDPLGDIVEPGNLHFADHADLRRSVGRKDVARQNCAGNAECCGTLK
jgi:hypothetical protein